MARTGGAARSEVRRRGRRPGRLWVAAGAVAVAGVFVVDALAAPPDPGVETRTSGSAAAGGVTVEGAEIDLGVVPLDRTVVPAWTLTNAGDAPVSLGQPHASVVEGCCPGPLLLGASDLGPGEATLLEFPLQMHAGMDGPHDFAVHVPVAGEAEVLTLRVVGDFGG